MQNKASRAVRDGWMRGWQESRIGGMEGWCVGSAGGPPSKLHITSGNLYVHCILKILKED